MAEEVTIESVQEEIAARDEKIEALEKKIDGLDSLNGKRGTEIGDFRKKMEEFEDEVKSLREDREALQTELKTLKEKNPDGDKKQKDTPPPENSPSDKEEADRLESEFTPDDIKATEEFVANLSDKDKKAFVNNDTFRVAVLKQVKSNTTKEVPESIWRVHKKPSLGDDVAERVRQLFKEHKSGNLVVDEKNGGYGKKQETQSVATAPPRFI